MEERGERQGEREKGRERRERERERDRHLRSVAAPHSQKLHCDFDFYSTSQVVLAYLSCEHAPGNWIFFPLHVTYQRRQFIGPAFCGFTKAPWSLAGAPAAGV